MIKDENAEMKIIKRALSLTAALAMTAASIPFVSAEENDTNFTAYAFNEAETSLQQADEAITDLTAESITYHKATLKDFEYSFSSDDEKSIIIKLYTAKYPNIEIPESIDGYKVVGIGIYAFKNNSTIRNIKLPSTVEYIGQEAFSYSKGLLTVQLADGIKSIKSSAFQGCSALKSINLPESLTEIEAYAFVSCNALESITIPSKVKTVKEILASCQNLKTVVIKGATTIANYALDDCPNLTSVTLPDNLEEIGEAAFRSCGSLKSISIPDTVNYIGEYAFSECTALASLKLPADLTSISPYTFEDCSSLTSVSIPKYVISIGEAAFNRCTSLKSITIPEGVQKIGKNAFAGNAAETLTIPKTVSVIGEYAFCASEQLTTLKICDGVTEIGNHAFRGCTELKNVTLSKTLTTIGENGFTLCQSLEKIDIPQSTEYIKDGAFSDCYKLSSAIIRNDYVEFGNNVFNGADVTIYGNDGSSAQAYAKENNLSFDYIAPAAPKITKAQGQDGKVALNWTAIDGATNYAVYTYVNGKWSVAGYRTATGMYVAGLTNGTKYGFAVKAYVNGKWSNITSADIVYATPVGAAAKPKITKAQGQNGQVALNWTAVNGATNYAVYYTVGGKWYNAGTRTSNGMYVKNLTNGTKYGFAVKAYVNGAWTAISSSDIVYATPVGTSAKPVITKAQGQDGKVALNWTSVNGATNYAVYTYLNGKWSVAGYRTAIGMYVTGLTNGTKYGFAVKAYVNGAWTNITSADIVYATPTAAKSDLMDTDFDDLSFLEDNGIDFVDVAPTVR